QRAAEIGAAGVDIAALQLVAVGKCDGVHQEIEATPLLLQHRKDMVELVILFHIGGEHEFRADRRRQRFQTFGLRLALIGERNLGTMRTKHAGNTPGDGMVVGDPHHQAPLALHQFGVCHLAPLGLFSLGMVRKRRTVRYTLYLWRWNTSVALVPPKPKLLESAVSIFALSMRLRTMFALATAGSISSILALSQMKPDCIISSV